MKTMMITQVAKGQVVQIHLNFDLGFPTLGVT
jgi:hypothetical protein